jgi:hypothetical protein
MAIEIPGFKLGTLATNTTTFATKQYHAVTQSSSAGIIATPSDGANMVGIMQNQPTISGEEVEIVTEGVSKAVFHNSLSVGDNYIIGTSGRLDSTSNAAAGAAIYGPVIIAAASSGTGSVLLKSVGITT